MGRYVGVKRLASNYSLAVLLPGIAFVPEAPWGRATRWRTVITVDSEQSAPPGPPIPSASSGQAWGEAIRLALEAENIESRPLWLLCHQPTTPPATCGYLVSPPAPQPFDPAQGRPWGEAIRLALEPEDIEPRPVWKPMHLQPVFRDCEVVVGGAVVEALFRDGLCLPSGTAMSEADLVRVIG